jgi:hypothetical protein
MRQTKTILLIVISVLLATAAWSREDKLRNTGMDPSAQGTIVTSTDRNGNTEVEVKVKHLAKPQKLVPPRQAYVVWVQPKGAQPELLGALRVNEDLEGSLKATTTQKDFEVLITAEDNVNPQVPSSNVLLRGDVERK